MLGYQAKECQAKYYILANNIYKIYKVDKVDNICFIKHC